LKNVQVIQLTTVLAVLAVFTEEEYYIFQLKQFDYAVWLTLNSLCTGIDLKGTLRHRLSHGRFSYTAKYISN